MNTVLFSVLLAIGIVAGIGLLIGLILSIASIVMAVPKNEKAEALLAVLPGANCGACGFSGCSGYAEALSKGKAKVGACPVGGESCAKDCAAVLGVDAEASVRQTAVVHCTGTTDNTSNKAQYMGLHSCAAAAKIGGGVTACTYGCLGLGDCERACPYDAIHVFNGAAIVNSDKCKACAICVRTCPRSIISLVPVKDMAINLCSNKDKGAAAKKACKTGCIGCRICEKNCPTKAIKVENNLAYIDPEKCNRCKECIGVCPQKSISFFDTVLLKEQ